MENLWPEKFEEADLSTPKEILEKQGKLLPKLTGDLVYAEVEDISKNEILVWGTTTTPNEKHFRYSFYIKGKFLENYRYRAFDIVHDIIIYPFFIRLDQPIREELGIKEAYCVIRNREEFISLLGHVLKSERIKVVISSIMSLSK